MSKSRGTFIKAETYLKHLRPEYLRYYFASKLSARVEDLDLNLDDFRQKPTATSSANWSTSPAAARRLSANTLMARLPPRCS